MFRALGNFLHRTPWWALIVIGLLTMLMLAVMSAPVNVMRLAKTGESTEMNRAIKLEIDNAFGESALGVAEGVVMAMRERATDPARKAELDHALEKIAESRAELFEVEAEAARAGKEAVQEQAQAARDIAESVRGAAREAAREVATTAIERARDAAESVLDAANERLETLESTRREVADALSSAKVPSEEALKQIDAQIVEARIQRDGARKAFETLSEKLAHTKDRKAPASPAPKSPVLPPPPPAPPPPAPPAPPAAPTPPKPGKGAASASVGSDGINIDGKLGGTNVKGKVVLGENSGIEIAIPPPPSPPSAPLPPLPPELRQEIRAKVASDVRRMGVGGVLILMFFPLFVMTLIAKFFIDRSRRAQAFAEVQQEVAETQSARRQIMEAKLQALQAQVEPHFLYNTLANVQALTEVDPPAANKMVGHLIEYLRSALPKMRENTSTIGQEVELVRAYLNILKMRMGERLAFNIDCPDDVALLPFPPLMLPSLVENAVKHGLEPQREGGRIEVIAQREGERLRVIVRDTGRGLGEASAQAGSGVGLDNLRQRLQAMFGDKARLTLESNTPQGVIATVEVPASGTPAMSPIAPDAAPAAPKTFAAKTWHVATKTHSVWANILVKTFVVALILLGALFLVALVGLATNLWPVEFMGHELAGIEGMALGTVVLLFAFAVVALALLLVIGIVYGLGFVAVALVIGIPVIVLLSLFPVLAPFAIGGFVVYWFWLRKKKSADNALNKEMP